MVIFVPASLVGNGIYHRVQNGDTRPTVVSMAGKVAGAGWAGLAPPTLAKWLSFAWGVAAEDASCGR